MANIGIILIYSINMKLKYLAIINKVLHDVWYVNLLILTH